MLEFREQAAATGIPIYLTRVRYDHADDALGGLFFRKVPSLMCFVAGNPLAEFVDGFAPRRGETVVTKHYPSAFAGTSLAASLTARGIDTVLIAGLSTSGCVRATALDALQNGFVPIVVRDCVGDRHRDAHASNLRDIAAKVGEVYSLAQASDYLNSLSGDAGPADSA